MLFVVFIVVFLVPLYKVLVSATGRAAFLSIFLAGLIATILFNNGIFFGLSLIALILCVIINSFRKHLKNCN